MKIALLHCYLPNKDFCNTTHTACERIELFLKERNPDWDYHIFEATQGDLPKDDDDSDAYFLSGSYFSAYKERPWIRELEGWIRKRVAERRKLFGICFGHQIIAQALGGKVEKSNQPIVLGLRETNVEESEQSPLVMHYAHMDQVVELPESAKTYLTADHCPYAGYKIEDFVMTTQGHPEYTDEYLRSVFEAFDDQLDQEIKDEGLTSLETHEADRDKFLEIITNFLVG